MGLKEWKELVLLLEQGISPDGLPINPKRTDPLSSEPGHYSYHYMKKVGKGKTATYVRVKSWYTIRRVPPS